jgi:hypothetical protein
MSRWAKVAYFIILARSLSTSLTHVFYSLSFPGNARKVTLPDGVVAGQTIHVQAPDGRLNAIVIPPGFGPGSTFTVEFAPDETTAVEAAPVAAAAAPYNPYAPPSSSAPMAAAATAQPYTVPPSQSRPDDGFASGFGSANGGGPVATPVYPTASAYRT